MRQLHIIHLLVRNQPKGKGEVHFLVYPHDKWLANGKPYLVLPTKKTVTEPLAPIQRGASVEQFVEAVMREDLGLREEDYALEEELEPVEKVMKSPTRGEPTRYTVYPIDVWVRPEAREDLPRRTKGQWVTCEQALRRRQVSPTAKAVFQMILEREARLEEEYALDPDKEGKAGAPQRLLVTVPDAPGMDALAMKWFSQNKGGVRYLPRQVIDEVLDAGNRAFNLRVADPYLHYQMQGVGFTWSFFTHKDKQDVHMHGAQVVEIYGVLEGEMEAWWKPYCDRGTSAWNHRIVGAGDWLEVDSLQCHIVHWRGPGKGVLLKAGPGPLAGVGRIGTEGKTSCKDCPYSCVKPGEVMELEGCPPGKASGSTAAPSSTPATP